VRICARHTQQADDSTGASPITGASRGAAALTRFAPHRLERGLHGIHLTPIAPIEPRRKDGTFWTPFFLPRLCVNFSYRGASGGHLGLLGFLGAFLCYLRALSAHSAISSHSSGGIA
jgi:hypothetical protein